MVGAPTRIWNAAHLVVAPAWYHRGVRGDPFEQGDLDLVRERFELARPYPRARRVAVMAIRVQKARPNLSASCRRNLKAR